MTSTAMDTEADLRRSRLDLMSVPIEAMAGPPPALVITAELDPRRDEGEAFAERLRAAGVAVDALRFEGACQKPFDAASVLDQAAQEEAAQARRSASGASIASVARAR